MREDMFKVIVERPRSGRSWASKSKLRYDKCEDRTSVSGKRLVKEYSGRTKHLNENLAPLKRYLHKQIGRKWDDVFSDICKHLDTGSTVKMHVREHLDDFVMRSTQINKNDEITGTDNWSTCTPPSEWNAELYVDPADGFLKKTSDLCKRLNVPTHKETWKAYYQNYRKVERSADIIFLTDSHMHVKLAGIWYEIEIEGSLIDSRGFRISDKELLFTFANREEQERRCLRVIKKVQLGKKQLKAHGLGNGKGGAYG